MTQNSTSDVKRWLQSQCSAYRYDLRGVFRANGEHDWPLEIRDAADLEQQLMTGGHLLPLPKESAALANVLEVSIVDFLLECVGGVDSAEAARGSERGYPDLELYGAGFGGGYHAVDIKVARRGATKRGPSDFTQSRVTLYTGNTYGTAPALVDLVG